jgi:ABC-2 type transport system ATP-binding protein
VTLAPNPVIVRAAGLSKSFAGRAVISRFSFDFPSGAYAITGRNGAGKSTLLALLAGALAPDEGDVVIADSSISRQPLDARRKLGYAPDGEFAYPFMTGAEFLQLVACARGAHGAQQAHPLIEAFGLAGFLATTFGAMSEGTKKKFALVSAVLGDPPVALLDEPANGLDAASLEHLTTLIATRARTGVVIFSAHQPELVAAVGAYAITEDVYARAA